jgi:hypothetical protein
MSGEADRLEKLERRLAHLEDREAIRDVIYRYCRAVDRADVELLKSCYWPDGFDDHGFYGGNAHEFAEFVGPLLRVTMSTTHSCSNPIIEIEGDKAYCETQVDVLHRIVEGDEFINEWAQCRYLDIFEKRDDVWRIAVRTATSDGIFWFKLKAQVATHRRRSFKASLPLGARHPEDPVYRLHALRDIVQEREPTTDFWGTLHSLGDQF